MTPQPAGDPSDAAPSDALPSDAVPSDAALFEIVHGQATAEEIAALTAVLAAAAAAARHRDAVPAAEPARSSGWADRSPLLRGPLAHFPGGWVASGRPH